MMTMVAEDATDSRKEILHDVEVVAIIVDIIYF